MLLREVVQELFYERTRIILTILAIAWGTFAIAIMLAVGEGLRINFAHTMANAGNNLLTVRGGHSSKQVKGLSANIIINLNRHDITTIKTLPNVQNVFPQYHFQAKLNHNGKSINTEFLAVTPEYAEVHRINVLGGGRFLNSFDVKNKSAVLVLGTLSLKQLFPHDSLVSGKTLLINNKQFLIVGAMQKKAELYSSGSPDSRLNWIPVTTYELFANPQIIDTIEVVYKDVKVLKDTEKQIRKIIALNHAADPEDLSVVNFSSLAKSQQEVNKFFLGMQIFLGIIGALTLLIAGIGIANVMYASVSRATPEIGTRMALGATPGQILFHYVAESLIASIIGGGIGILLAIGVVVLIRMIPLHGELIDAIGKPQPILSFLVLAVVVSVLGVVGFLAGFFPARKAAKIDPAEALSYE